MGKTTGERPPPLASVKREGITRRPRERTAARLPVSERHAQVLELLSDEPARGVKLARDVGLTASQTQSALYALQDRGLAERVPWKGWRRAATE